VSKQTAGPDPTDPGTLMSVRVDEVPNDAGPLMYEVFALWSASGWAKPKQFFTMGEARAYASTLLDGLDVNRPRSTIFHWAVNAGDDS
jgi:hypothetical protein